MEVWPRSGRLKALWKARLAARLKRSRHLLLAEEKILVPATDKDIKCLCPGAGGGLCRSTVMNTNGEDAAAAVPSGPRFLLHSAAAAATATMHGNARLNIC